MQFGQWLTREQRMEDVCHASRERTLLVMRLPFAKEAWRRKLPCDAGSNMLHYPFTGGGGPSDTCADRGV
jgi:hypothetical protein